MLLVILIPCTPLLMVIIMKLPKTLLINLLLQSKCMLIGIASS